MLKGYTGMIKLVEKEHCSGCTACMVCCPKEAISMCADEEGFKAIAVTFRMVAKVEAEHEARYRKLLERVEAGKFFEEDEEIEWQCRNCGYVHKGKKAPEKCPACAHPQAYFERKKNNY